MSSAQLASLGMSLNLDVVGWTDPAGVWRYVKQTRRAGTRDMAIIKFTPRSDKDLKHYAALLARIHKSGRLAVTGPASVHVKDLYIVPLLKDDPIPPELDPLIKGSTKSFRMDPNLDVLLGIFFFLCRFGAGQKEKSPYRDRRPGPEKATWAG